MSSQKQLLYEMGAAEVLTRLGIPYRQKADGKGVWFNFKTCPLCEHNGHQCGLTEFPDGRKAVKCWHADDNPFNTEDIGIRDFYDHIGADRLLLLLGDSPSPLPSPQPVPKKKPVEIHLASMSTISETVGRLETNDEAMKYLLDRGLTRSTIQRFKMGLSKPYADRKTGELISSDRLTVPILNQEFEATKPFAYLPIPGVTDGLKTEPGCQGSPRVYYSERLQDQRYAFICEGMKDLWILWQKLQKNDLADDVVLMSSTHGTNVPDAMKDPAFFGRFEKVFVGTDADGPGDRFAQKIFREISHTHVVRVRPTVGKDWTDFFKWHGIEAFLYLLEEAKPASLSNDVSAYEPISLQISYVNGFLYYPISGINEGKKEITSKDSRTKVIKTETRKTFVVRSDRQIQEICTAAREEGSPYNAAVIRLHPDGSLIDRIPEENQHSSWEFNTIKQWTQGTWQQMDLREILANVEAVIRAAVWLPQEEDYALLAATVPVTYVQAVFDAVPLILCNGAKNTGKSTIGEALTHLCYNGVTLGPSSAASLVRLTDSSQGAFVYLDDMEGIGGSMRSGDGRFDEIIQVLKTGYKKATAKKAVYDGKAGRHKVLNFYGVKAASNTSGVDAILGSRMFRINTRKIPAHLLAGDNPVRVGRIQAERAHDIRQHLHTWAFDEVSKVAAKYKEILPHSNDREEEIGAPLRVVAALSGDPAFVKRVEAALARQWDARLEDEDDDTIIEAAAAALVLEGHFEFPAALVAMMAAMMVGESYGMTVSSEIPKWKQTRYIGSYLKQAGIIDDAAIRPRVWEGGPQLRTHSATPEFLMRVSEAHVVSIDEMRARKRPINAWCARCAECSFQGVCENVSGLRPQREAYERKQAARRLYEG